MTLSALALACVLAPVPVKEKPEPPKGPAPGFLVIHGANKANKTVTTGHQVYVPVTKERDVTVTVNQGGVPVERTQKIAVTEYVVEQRMQEIRIDGSATDGAGNKLTEAQLWDRLGAGRVVVVNRDKNPLDPAFVALFKPDVVILNLPPANLTAPPPGVGPVPVPLPPGAAPLPVAPPPPPPADR